MSPVLSELSKKLSDRLQCDAIEVVRDARGPGDAGITNLEDRVRHTAKIRQSIVEDYLQPHYTHVLWIDADIIDYSLTLISSIYRTSIEYNAIVAPMVLLDGQDRFYDIAGFIKNWKWTNINYPYCMEPGRRFINMDSVGCFYIVPAFVYRGGAKHLYNPAHPTDHMGVCQFGKCLGCRVLCDTKLIVRHAVLSDYGESLH